MHGTPAVRGLHQSGARGCRFGALRAGLPIQRPPRRAGQGRRCGAAAAPVRVGCGPPVAIGYANHDRACV